MVQIPQLPEYRIFGSGDVSVFMLHGAYGDGRYFDNTANYLAEQGYRVVVWNAPGYGKSDPKADFTIESAGSAAEALVQAEGTSTNIIFGHSMGSLIAPNAVTKLGDKIHGVVLSGASLGFKEFTPEAQERFVAERLAPIEEQGLSVAEYSPALLTSMMAPGAANEYVDHVRRVVTDMRTDTFVAAMKAIVMYDNVPAIKQISVPTLLISGKYDTACPPSGMETMHELISGSEYHMIEEAGHYAFAETPEKFHGILINFLNQQFPLAPQR